MHVRPGFARVAAGLPPTGPDGVNLRIEAHVSGKNTVVSHVVGHCTEMGDTAVPQ